MTDILPEYYALEIFRVRCDKSSIRLQWMTELQMVIVFVLRDLVIKMTWDDENTPAVEVPLGDFSAVALQKNVL